jgi:hypothetical protein
MGTPTNPDEDEVNGRNGGIAKKQRRSGMKEVQLHGTVDILAVIGSQSHYSL